MTIKIEAAQSMDDGRFPPIDAYADHEVAMKAPTGVRFEGGVCDGDGNFPNIAHKGVPDSDAHHVHAIMYAGVVHRASVSFMDGTKRAGWIFYFPTSGASGTYSRYISPSTKYRSEKIAVADAVFRDFFAACPKMPGATANAAMLSQRNKTIAEDEKAKQQEAEKKASTKSAVVVSSSAKDNKHFAQAVAVMGDDQVKTILDKYVAAGGTFKYPESDKKMIATGLRGGGAKETWPGLVRSYYDAIMAVKG